MAEIWVPDGEAKAHIRYRLTGDAEEMVITLGLRDTIGELTDANDAAAELLAAWQATMHPAAANLTTGWTLVGTTVYVKDDPNGFEVGEALVNLVGTGAGTTLPPNCAYLVKKNTGVGGRRNRGRFFLPQVVLTEGDVSAAGFIDAADVTALQAQLDNFVTNLAANDLIPVLLHYPSVAVPEPPSTPITSFTLDPQIATQRRRLR